ncbi:unnamed protein product [Allacma fusca]|uniref:Uncharacterized protein n=1 Tax=Allacma fusca TaxID=39272 RepID=A0A8J2K1Q1_9HEXA|nr:unnamed protein product [Allacma fusca]
MGKLAHSNITKRDYFVCLGFLIHNSQRKCIQRIIFKPDNFQISDACKASIVSRANQRPIPLNRNSPPNITLRRTSFGFQELIHSWEVSLLSERLIFCSAWLYLLTHHFRSSELKCLHPLFMAILFSLSQTLTRRNIQDYVYLLQRPSFPCLDFTPLLSVGSC